MDDRTKQERKSDAKAFRDFRRRLIKSGVKIKGKTKRHAGTYSDRNRLLKEMGFDSYAHYLSSELYADIKKMAWLKHGNKCQLCNNLAEVLHHKGYGRAVLQGTYLKPLVPLCHSCHHKVEFDDKGKKRTLNEAHTAFTRLLKAYRGDESENGSEAEEVDINWARKRNRCPVCRSLLPKKGNEDCKTCARAQAGKDTTSYKEKSKPKPKSKPHPPCMVCGKSGCSRYMAPKLNTLDYKARPRPACHNCVQLLTSISRSEEFDALSFQSHSVMTFFLLRAAREKIKR